MSEIINRVNTKKEKGVFWVALVVIILFVVGGIGVALKADLEDQNIVEKVATTTPQYKYHSSLECGGQLKAGIVYRDEKLDSEESLSSFVFEVSKTQGILCSLMSVVELQN